MPTFSLIGFHYFFTMGPLIIKKTQRGDAFYYPTGTLRSQIMRININLTQMSRFRLATNPNARNVVVIIPDRRR